MACSNNQGGVFPGRAQMPTPPCMNTNCSSMGSDYNAVAQMNQGMGLRYQQAYYQEDQPVEAMFAKLPPIGAIENNTSMPVAMAYVPWQQFNQTYPVEQAMSRGTLFPELDFPFVMGRCR